MPDVIMQRLSTVRFTTSSDDFKAIVRGPAGNKQKKAIQDGQALPSTKPGAYTLEVRDRKLRKLTVTLKCTDNPATALPAKYVESDDETVIVSFQVL